MKTRSVVILFLLLLAWQSIAFANGSSRYDSIVNKCKDKSLVELTRLAYKHLEQNAYDDALAIYSVAISKGTDALNRQEMREYVKAINNVGYIYLFDRCNPEKAYPYFLNARRLAEKTGEEDLLAAILDNLAKVYDDFGDSEKAIDTYNLAMEHAVKSKTEVSATIQLMILNDMINCAMAHEMTANIGTSLEKFAKLPEYNLPMARYSKTMCYGLQLLLRGNIEKATNVIGNAEKLIDAKVDSARYVADHNLTMSNLYHIRGMEDSARIYLDHALNTATNHHITDRLPRIYYGMSVVAAANGDSADSRRLRLLAYEADHNQHSSKLYASLNSLDASQKIDELNMQLKEADIRHSHRVTVIWILTVGILLVAILLTYIFIRNRHLSASLHELVARHKASIETEEVNARLRHEYEETIAILRNEIENREKQIADCTESPVEQKRLSLPVDDDERLRIIGRVTDIFTQSPEIYDPDFSLERLAEMTDTKSRYLSALLNETMGKSFSGMLAEARIKRACTLLLSPEFKKTKTIESIAAEVGYRSRTHFSSIFKKITGVTPLQYVAMSA